MEWLWFVLEFWGTVIVLGLLVFRVRESRRRRRRREALKRLHRQDPTKIKALIELVYQNGLREETMDAARHQMQAAPHTNGEVVVALTSVVAAWIDVLVLTKLDAEDAADLAIGSVEMLEHHLTTLINKRHPELAEKTK